MQLITKLRKHYRYLTIHSVYHANSNLVVITITQPTPHGYRMLRVVVDVRYQLEHIIYIINNFYLTEQYNE